MSEFVHALIQYDFLQVALLTGLLASVACGIVGTYVVVRRITAIAGGIAHCVLGGMGAARYAQVVHGWSWAKPLYGALFAALLAALIIGMASLRAREREDTVIGALWAIGMATGILFISLTPGYSADLMNYLFGNILMVSRQDLWLIVTLDLIVVVTSLVCFHQLQAICFDEEYAKLRGLNVEGYFLLLLSLIALTVVLLVTVVGIVMVIALLTLPVAIAGQLSKRLGQMMWLAMLICALLTSGGLAISYAPDLPTGATIVLLAGGAYVVMFLGKIFLPRIRHRRTVQKRSSASSPKNSCQV